MDGVDFVVDDGTGRMVVDLRVTQFEAGNKQRFTERRRSLSSPTRTSAGRRGASPAALL